jgi:hypothetical protein
MLNTCLVLKIFEDWFPMVNSSIPAFIHLTTQLYKETLSSLKRQNTKRQDNLREPEAEQGMRGKQLRPGSAA